MKPGEQAHEAGEPRAVEPSGQAEQRSAVVVNVEPLDRNQSFAHAHGSEPL